MAEVEKIVKFDRQFDGEKLRVEIGGL